MCKLWVLRINNLHSKGEREKELVSRYAVYIGKEWQVNIAAIVNTIKKTNNKQICKII